MDSRSQRGIVCIYLLCKSWQTRPQFDRRGLALFLQRNFREGEMTKIKLNEFRNTLMLRKSELENGSRSRGALAIETSPEEFDRIQQAQDRDLAIGSLDRDAKLLREVRAALSRLDGGVFGICRDCDGEIGMKRLAAVPWTASCIECQEAADRAGAGDVWSAAQELLVGAE